MRFSRTAWVPALLLVALVISLGAVDSAWARGGGWGCMNANVTPEQSAQLFDLKQQFMNDTADLRKQMMVKRTELAALWQIILTRLNLFTKICKFKIISFIIHT